MKTSITLAVLTCMIAACSSPPVVVLQETNGHFTFESEMKFPSKIDVFAPDKALILTFEFSEMKRSADSAMPEIAIKNSSGRPLSLSYKILGYDDNRRGMSEGDDNVHLAPNESVLRQLIPSPNALNLRVAASFRLVGNIQY